MDLLKLVREIENVPDDAAPARIARSRAAVMQAISEKPQPRSRQRWVWGGTAAGLLSAATITAVVVVTSTVAPVSAQPASAAARAVVNGAADLVITGVDPVVAPGQYLLIRETYELVALWDVSEDPDTADPLSGWNTPTLTTAEGAVHARGIRDLYVPSDRSGDWILDDRFVNEAIEVYGHPATLRAYERLTEESSAPPGTDSDPAGIEALPGGLQTGLPDFADDDYWWDPLRDFYDEMPRDPERLLEWYRQQFSATSTDDWYVFQAIGQSLSSDLMPADLRAASLRTLGLLNNVDVAGTAGSVTTIAMRTNLSPFHEFGNLHVSELDVDTSTGRIVGIRESYPNRSTDLLPENIPWASFRIDVTVVDAAPQP